MNKLIILLKTSTFKNSFIVTGSTIINGLLGAFFYITLARVLGPVEFGLLTVSIVTLTLIADIADIGTNAGIIRFVAKELKDNKQKSYKILKLSLEIKIAVWVIILLLGLIFAPLIAKFIFHQESLIIPLRLVFVGVGGALLFSYGTASLQALQKFLSWGIINITTNLARAVVLILLISFHQANLFNSLLTYITLPFFGFLLATTILPIRMIILVKNEKEEIKDVFEYNRWIALFSIIAALSSRVDIFLTTHLLSARELGIYSAANQITSYIPQLVSALGLVVAPRFASFNDFESMFAYFKKIQLLVILIAGVGVLLLPFAGVLINILYGSQYNQAVLPFILLMMAMLIFLISLPVHASIMYYYANPKLFLVLSIIRLVSVTLLGYLLISSLGIVGSAIVVLIGTLLDFIIPVVWFVIKINKQRE